jgi:hypothetical protein
MTQTSPIGRRAAGTKREIAILATEAALDKPKRLPASRFLNDIARDALAAVFRDDSEAIADLPTAVTFRAFVVKSRRHIGCWRLVITTKAYGAWGHCMSAPIANHEWVAALAEMINGPATATAAAAAPNHTNSAEPTPSVHTVSTRCADRLGALAARFATLFVQRTVRAPQSSAAAEPQTAPVQNANSQSKANTAVGSLSCASLPTAS